MYNQEGSTIAAIIWVLNVLIAWSIVPIVAFALSKI